MLQTSHIVIAGAGHIGCYAGGLLAAAGHRVSLLARPGVVETVLAQGLHLTDLDGLDVNVTPEALGATTDPAVLSTADIVLVTVKARRDRRHRRRNCHPRARRGGCGQPAERGAQHRCSAPPVAGP